MQFLDDQPRAEGDGMRSRRAVLRTPCCTATHLLCAPRLWILREAARAQRQRGRFPRVARNARNSGDIWWYRSSHEHRVLFCHMLA